MRILKERFSCQREGLTIRGTQYRPEGCADLPVAILCHGFMANQGTVRRYARFLAGRGFAAFCFDFCGGCVIGSRSDGATTDMSVLTEVRDLQAVIAHALSLPHTRPEGLTLLGCSQGGLVCALTAASLPQQVSRLILLYPAFCIPDDARAGQMMLARFDPSCIPETFRCGPMKLGRCYAADVMDMDLPEALMPYGGDVLLLHGERDRIVPISYSEGAIAAWKRRQDSGRSILMHAHPRAGHGFSAAADRWAMAKIVDFLA